MMELNKKDEAYSKAYFRVLNFLSFSKRSKKELLDKIEKYLSKTYLPKKDKDDVREQIIQNLKTDGYLKETIDEDFANSYVQGLRNSGKSFNGIRISQFLSKKGIPKEIINDVISNIDDEAVYESVLKDAEKKLRSLKNESALRKKQKLLNFLYRKGYPFDIVSSVVDTLL